MPRSKKEIKPVKSKRGRKSHIDLVDMDQFYQLVNKIQVDKEITYIRFSDNEIAPMVENILKDAGLEFGKKFKKGVFLYRIKPTFSTPSIEQIEVEMLEDEIIEEGQLF